MYVVFGVAVALAYPSVGLKTGLLFGLIALLTLYIVKIVLTLPIVGMLPLDVRLANMARIEIFEDVLVGIVFSGCSYLYRPALGLAALGTSVVSVWMNEASRKELRARELGTTREEDPAVDFGVDEGDDFAGEPAEDERSARERKRLSDGALLTPPELEPRHTPAVAAGHLAGTLRATPEQLKEWQDEEQARLARMERLARKLASLPPNAFVTPPGPDEPRTTTGSVGPVTAPTPVEGDTPESFQKWMDEQRAQISKGQPHAANGRFGYDETNPIPVHALQYCGRLRCDQGHPFWFHRVGSLGEGPDGHIVDQMELLCFGRETRAILHFDMYHSDLGQRAPTGLSLGEPGGRGTTRGQVDPFPEGLDSDPN